MRRVTAVVRFDVPDDVTDEQVDYILGTLAAQVDGEGLVGYDDTALNEQVVPIPWSDVERVEELPVASGSVLRRLEGGEGDGR